jgi:hypothetical protein
MVGFRRTRAVAAVVCAGIAMGLLVVGTIPVKGFESVVSTERLQLRLGVDLCWLVIAWDAPAARPPPGTWAGQTNRLGFRYNRYSDGSGNVRAPIWLFALPPLLAALIIAPRTRRRFPVTRTALLALPAIVLGLLWIRSYTVNAGFHVLGELSVDLRSGDAELQRLEAVKSGRYVGYRVRPLARFPLWPLLGASIFALGMQLRRYRRRCESMDMLCPTCGYDLRATPVRCPECGMSCQSGDLPR